MEWRKAKRRRLAYSTPALTSSNEAIQHEEATVSLLRNAYEPSNTVQPNAPCFLYARLQSRLRC